MKRKEPDAEIVPESRPNTCRRGVSRTAVMCAAVVLLVIGGLTWLAWDTYTGFRNHERKIQGGYFALGVTGDSDRLRHLELFTPEEIDALVAERAHHDEIMSEFGERPTDAQDRSEEARVMQRVAEILGLVRESK
jgi:hypothetical protein